jgi:hypothetical protein
MATKHQQPMQPLVWDKGVIRFKRNALVCYLLDHGGIDLNQLAGVRASREDREQLAQLIGYSVSGFGDLNYARRSTVARADDLADKIYKRRFPKR